MWLFLSGAFLSIVEPPADSDHLLVRARVKGDLERIFPGRGKALETPVRDYRFRMFIPREVVARVLAEQVMRLSYGNFKSSVHEKDRHDAYFRVWGVMNDFQTDRLYPKPVGRRWGMAEDRDIMGPGLPFEQDPDEDPYRFLDTPSAKSGQNKGKRRPRRN